MATIRKRNGRWQVQVRRKGHRAVSRSFRVKADALTWARQIEAKADRGTLPPDPRALEHLNLGAILVRYRDTVVVAKRCREVESVILNALLRTGMAALPLAVLTPAVLAEYRDSRLARVKPITVNRELALIQHALDLACQEWNVPFFDNPVRRVRKPRPGPGRDRRLLAGELEKLLTACAKCRNQLIRPLIMCALETGLRQGELLRLRWRDVRLDSCTLRVLLTKNGSTRTIPLSPAAVALLRSLRDGQIDPDACVFPTTARAVKLAWKRLTTRAYIVDLNFHDLRHEAVSRFFEKGLSMPEVAAISGHRDPRMLLRYTHLSTDTIAKKLASL